MLKTCKTQSSFIERNNKVVALYTSGSTMEEVGKNYDLSKERVRQILRDNNIVPRHRGKAQYVFRSTKHCKKCNKPLWWGSSVDYCRKCYQRIRVRNNKLGTKEKMKGICVTIPTWAIDELTSTAKSNNVSVSSVIRNIITKHFNSNNTEGENELQK